MPSIRAPDNAPDVVTAIKHLFSNRLHTDFCFISRDGRDKHQVHRLIVGIQSPVLAKDLYGDNPIEFYQIKYDDNLALLNLISFFYNEDLVLENISDIRHTKAIADRFQVSGLSEICKYELIHIPVCVSDVLSILEMAREFQNAEKEKDCLILISENQDTIFSSREFLGLPFRRVLNIFEKIKHINRMTEALFLRLGIRWLDKNGITDNNELLKEKVDMSSISLNDYIDIVIDFPVFFNGTEISYTLNKLKSQLSGQVVQQNILQERIMPQKEYRDVETNTEIIKCIQTTAKSDDKDKEQIQQLQADLNFFKHEYNSANKENHELEKKCNVLSIESERKDLEIDDKSRKLKELEQTIKKMQQKYETSSPMPSLSYASLDSKQKILKIQILTQEDGINVFELEKRARITVQEGNTIRSLQIAIDDVLKIGLIGTVADKKGNYSESDVDISYEGVYFMLRSLKHLDESFSPIQSIEVLKAALYFQLKDIAERCIKRISGVTDYDPLFLDGLIALSYLKDKCLGLKGLSELKDKSISLLLSEPLRVILHPNFAKCSVDLILLLLQQSELKVKDESQLLVVVIAWLESQKEARKLFRTILLKRIAFQNISTADFRYTISHYPDFFDEKEQKLILAYRNAVGSEIKFFRENLPEWYSSVTRKHI